MLDEKEAERLRLVDKAAADAAVDAARKAILARLDAEEAAAAAAPAPQDVVMAEAPPVLRRRCPRRYNNTFLS